MCLCTPNIRTPFCGKPGCEWPQQQSATLPHSSMVIYAAIIAHLRRRAKELGYAIAVHGSLARDIDLLACPWTDEAVPAHELAEALREQAANSWGTKVYSRHDDPGIKPHGRLAWTLFFAHGETFIDLSVMPTVATKEM